MRKHRLLAAAVSAALTTTALPASSAAQPTETAPGAPPATQDYVTREEYERLRAELQAVRRKVDEPPAATGAEVAARADADARRGGIGPMFDTDRFLVTGYTQAGFVDSHAGVSTFAASLNPIFLWNITDRVFVEAEVEMGLTNEGGEGETDVGLEYADINFILSDYATLRVGKFLTPFGQFPERLHPAWINKLPDFPLVYTEDGGLVPFASLGAEVRGAVPLRSGGDSKLVYAAYVANGPSLITDDPDAAGTITDTNFDDLNSNKTVGGRVGYLPVPELEVGASVLYGDVADGTNALIWGVDASYSRDISAIRGTLDARTEWVWSDVETMTFDPTGAEGFGPLRFANKRHGGYVQLAYRPTQVDSKFIRNLEFVGRYDELHVPAKAPGLVSARRATFGVDYWLTSNVVFKAAFRLDDPSHGEHDNAFFLQAAVGF